jgi:hypothetical protein
MFVNALIIDLFLFRAVLYIIWAISSLIVLFLIIVHRKSHKNDGNVPDIVA